MQKYDNVRGLKGGVRMDLYTRYFMFSNEHLNKIKELAAKNGDMNPKIGKVLVAGNYKK